jgi:hypothetical protein
MTDTNANYTSIDSIVILYSIIHYIVTDDMMMTTLISDDNDCVDCVPDSYLLFLIEASTMINH